MVHRGRCPGVQWADLACLAQHDPRTGSRAPGTGDRRLVDTQWTKAVEARATRGRMDPDGALLRREAAGLGDRASQACEGTRSASGDSGGRYRNE